MKLAFNYAIAAVILLLGFVAPVIAGPLEDGVSAFGRGDYAAAEAILRQLADQGGAEAQYYLGSMYYEGHEVPRRYIVAAQWYRKAAKQGYRDAQAALGEMYFGGYGVPQNDAMAIVWWRKAADQGDCGGKLRTKVTLAPRTLSGSCLRRALAFRRTLSLHTSGTV